MAKPALGYFDYVKAAFRRRLPVPLMGLMPVNQMVLGVIAVLGIANPGFWLLGAAAELGYLTLLSSNPRFQKLVQGEHLQQAQSGWDEQIESSVNQLSPPSRVRYRELLNKCRAVLGITTSLDATSIGDLRGQRAASLNQLLTLFLRLLRSRELTVDNLRNVDPRALQGEIQRIETRLGALDADKDAALVRSLRGTLEIQKRRLTNLERGRTSLEVIDAELRRIEQQVELIREESALTGRADDVGDRLDSVSAMMAETTRWMEDNADLLGSLSETDAPLGDLPHLGRVGETE